MSLPSSQLQILAAIENELQADPELDADFSAFTSVARSADMPAAEQLAAPDSLSGWRGWRRRTGRPAFLGRMIVPLAVLAAAYVITLVTVLAALSVVDHGCRGPTGTSVRAGYAATSCTGLHRHFGHAAAG